MRIFLLLTFVVLLVTSASAEPPRAIKEGARPQDTRLGKLRTTHDSEFPMQPVRSINDWPTQRDGIRQRILVAAGLHPMPQRSPLNAIVHGKVERDDYTVERVIFESFPGHYVTGSLYRPKSPANGKRPAVLSPHGHWEEGRFDDLGAEAAQQEIASGAEQFEVGGRYAIQARCVQLARMGCIVFVYDMEGYADSVQLVDHRLGPRADNPNQAGYLLFSPEAELHGQTLFGLQTWNSIRAIDFISSLDDVDTNRIAVTGASGGGTQSMIIGAIDQRIEASMPAVMVSTAMQGGCACENAQYLRINQGNVDIAAATAPRPLGLIAADDWTKELETKGHPELMTLYQQLGHPDLYEAHFHLEFPHNYNSVNRHHMYNFMNRHLKLGLSEPIVEREFIPLDVATEATVWTEEYPKPTGENIGEAHERKLTAEWTKATNATLQDLSEADGQRVIAEGIDTFVGRSPVEVGDVQWSERTSVERGDIQILAGTLTASEHGEQLPAIFISSKRNSNGQVVVWLSDKGKLGLFGVDGKPLPEIAALLNKGFSIASIDMFGQGEFTDNGEAVEAVQINIGGDGEEPYMHAACFHFGFNPPLVIQRVHDVLSLVAYLRGEEPKQVKADRVHLVAIGKQAGLVGLLARAILGDRIAKSVVDVVDFNFSSADSFDDPNFLPGILRYGGMDSLWKLNRPFGVVEIDGPGDVLNALEAGRDDQTPQ